jgi:hypothetical protein
MSQFGAWFYETLQDCFEIHYGWNLNECMGKAATGSNKYYVDWTAATCVKDCSTGADCEGLAESWEVVGSFSTKEECCHQRLG